MEQTRRASTGLGRGQSAGRGVRFALIAVSGLTLGQTGAHAALPADCRAVNQGALNVELEGEGRTVRHAALKPGDTLTFQFEAPSGPFGTLTLLEGAGAPRSLLVGPTGTSVTFVAAKRGAFGFEFTKEGSETASFTASCVPAGSAARGSTRSGRQASRDRAKAIPEAWRKAEDLEAAEFAGFDLETAAAVPGQVGAAAPWADARPPAGTAVTQAGPLDMKLQWRGERYRLGPDGLETDHSASGVDAALNYKLLPEIMIGALAQVDQPGDRLIGAPLALSDQGWMAGPVTTVKLAPGLSLDARAAWGVAENATDALAANTVATSRRTVSARLANTQSFGPWRLTPSISVNHFQSETATSPATETADTAASYGAGFGRVDIGPEFAYRIDLEKSAFIEPRAVIGSFWDIDSLSRLAPGKGGHGDVRLKAEAGVTIGTGDGTKLQATGGVEEGVQDAENVWSGRLQLSVPMK